MPTVAAVVFCVLLAALAVFQIALAAGAPLGRLAWGGQSEVLTSRMRASSIIAVVLYVVFGLVALERVGILDLVGWDVAVQVAMWVIAGYLLLATVLNLLSRSTAERFVMGPVSLLLGILACVVAAAPA